MLLSSSLPRKATFRCDDGDANENVKKAIGLISKTTTLHVQHKFRTFFVVDTRLRRDIPSCDVFLPLNLGADSLPGRRSKGKGKGIRARDHARGRREEGNAFLYILPRAPKFPLSRSPSPSPFNACHAG